MQFLENVSEIILQKNKNAIIVKKIAFLILLYFLMNYFIRGARTKITYF